MDRLIAILADAKGPSRDLDALIEIEVRRFQAYAAGLNDKQRAHWVVFGNKGEIEEGGCRYHAPTYSFSLDAAVKLIPDGWEWQASNRAPKPKAGRAYIHNKQLINVGVGGVTPNPKYRGHEVTAATPAIAMCIVGLMANERQ